MITMKMQIRSLAIADFLAIGSPPAVLAANPAAPKRRAIPAASHTPTAGGCRRRATPLSSLCPPSLPALRVLGAVPGLLPASSPASHLLEPDSLVLLLRRSQIHRRPGESSRPCRAAP